MLLDDDQEPEERKPFGPTYLAEILRLVVRDFRKIAGPCPSCGHRPKIIVGPGNEPVRVGCHGSDCIDRMTALPETLLVESLQSVDGYVKTLGLALQYWGGLKGEPGSGR